MKVLRNAQWGKHNRKFGTVLLIFIGFILVLTACGVTETRAPSTEVEEPYELYEGLLVNTEVDRSSAQVLDMSVVTSDIYLFFAEEGVERVSLYIDDTERQGAPYANFFPSGLATESVNKLDTQALTDGMHTATADTRYADGSAKLASAAFLVDNRGELADRLLVSKRADRSDAKLLGEGSLTGDAHIFVVPSSRVEQVNFYVDDSGRKGSPDQIERIPYYDLAGTAKGGKAQGFDTSDLKNGDHTFTAEIVSTSGKKTVVSKTAKVSNSGTTASPEPNDPSPSPKAKGKYALRGDPGFSRGDLSSSQREWYDALWEAIDNPDQYPNAIKLAKSDNSYLYRGDLQDYTTSLLLAFRMTGDLRLLDQVDRIAQLMREELADGWRGTRDGTDGTKDGFLNWVDRHDTSSQFAGKDVQVAYDLKANALVSEIAWALQNNRDLKSPSGVNYGAHADFWENYLVNHFEAKWRKRNGVRSGFPFAKHYTFHTYHSFMKWHYYMGKLTGNSTYTKEAERMADILWDDEFKATSSEYGSALVWARGALSLIDAQEEWRSNFLMPTTYARYVIQEAVDLHFEGFDKYASDSTMAKLANTVSAFVIDDNSFDSFARDIGGGKSRAGIAASSSSDWSEMSSSRFAESAWSYLAAWDANSGGRIQKAARDVFYTVENQRYSQTPKRVFIPTAMLLKTTLQ